MREMTEEFTALLRQRKYMWASYKMDRETKMKDRLSWKMFGKEMYVFKYLQNTDVTYPILGNIYKEITNWLNQSMVTGKCFILLNKQRKCLD